MSELNFDVYSMAKELAPNWGTWLYIVISYVVILLAVPFFPFERVREYKLFRFLEQQKSFFLFLLIALIAFVALSLIAAFIQNFHMTDFSHDPAHWGQMGDFFGGMLNPILAFASFIALLYTIRIQSNELELTRKEFEKSVKAQSDLAAETRAQVNLFGMQNVLNTFNSYYGVLERTIDKDGERVGKLSILPKISYSGYVTYDGSHLADVTFQKDIHRELICSEINRLRINTSISCVNTDSVNALFEVLSFLYAQLKRDGNEQIDVLDSHNLVISGCARLSIMQMNPHMILNICVYYLLLNKEHESRRKLVVEFKVLDIVFAKFEGNKGLCAVLYFMIFYDLKPDEHLLLSGYQHFIEKVKFIDNIDA